MQNKYVELIQTAFHDQYQLLRIKIKVFTDKLNLWIKKYWFKTAMLGILIWVIVIKDVSVNLNLQAIQQNPFQSTQSAEALPSSYHSQQTSYTENKEVKSKKPNVPRKRKTKKEKHSNGNDMNTYSNLPFDGSSKKISESSKKRAAKKKKQLAYIKKYKKLARKEMDLYDIPVSITLAQGLLESNVGASRLARKNNNHFGMKCFSRRCKKGHCSNFTDDSHKDFFRKYRNVADSFRAHSKLLRNGKRYRSLFKLERTNYKGWARGLKEAGYATDKNYHNKLIGLIENLNLDKYDN